MPDEMKEKYADTVIAAYSGEAEQYPGLVVFFQRPSIHEPAGSSSVWLHNRPIPKRLQNCNMSEMTAKQTRHRMDARQYLTCLYMGLEIHFDRTTEITTVGEFGLYIVIRICSWPSPTMKSPGQNPTCQRAAAPAQTRQLPRHSPYRSGFKTAQCPKLPRSSINSVWRHDTI